MVKHLSPRMGGKHTTLPAGAGSGRPLYLERKTKSDGTVHEYPTEMVHRDGRVVIVLFRMTEGGGPPRLPVTVPAGSVSLGYFWGRRPYNLYRMLDPAGRVIAHRFDAVTDVRIGAESVDYRDLALDWWALPDEMLIEEDRDEFEAALLSGEIGQSDGERAAEAARQVYSRYRHIIDEAEELERRYFTASAG